MTSAEQHDSANCAEAGLPERYQRYLVPQDYALYTAEDHRVWDAVVYRNTALWIEFRDRIHPAHLDGMRRLELDSRVPRLETLNERLAPTGWRTVCVDGYIPSSAYVGLMARKVFPVSRRVRRPEHIDFAPAPDLVHDVLGHLPLLFCAEHREFLQRLASVMSQAEGNELDHEFYEANTALADMLETGTTDAAMLGQAQARVRAVNERLVHNASELTQLRRMYVWSVEFGLLGQHADYLVYGAAMLSSASELRAVCERPPSILPYSLEVIGYENAFSDLVAQYFVAPNFSRLHAVLDAYAERMHQQQASRVNSEVRGLSPGGSELPRRKHA